LLFYELLDIVIMRPCCGAFKRPRAWRLGTPAGAAWRTLILIKARPGVRAA